MLKKGIVDFVCLVLPSIRIQKGETKAVFIAVIVTSRQLKASTFFVSPFQVLTFLSTFKTVIISPSVIVSSMIRQSFSRTFVCYCFTQM